jgi:hypothetical protein
MKKTTLALIAIMVLLLQTLVFLPSIAGTPNTEQLKTKFNDQLSKQNTVVFEENPNWRKNAAKSLHSVLVPPLFGICNPELR